jgi:heme exporter protein D
VNLGPHASFIIIAYAAAGAVIAVLIAWVAADYQAQRRVLTDLEARGITRRSSKEAA